MKQIDRTRIERLGRTQSALSHALARLRRQLGDPLLVRIGGTMQPSPLALAETNRLATGCVRYTGAHGLRIDNPAWTKSPAFHVTAASSCTLAVAAISASGCGSRLGESCGGKLGA